MSAPFEQVTVAPRYFSGIKISGQIQRSLMPASGGTLIRNRDLPFVRAIRAFRLPFFCLVAARDDQRVAPLEVLVLRDLTLHPKLFLCRDLA